MTVLASSSSQDFKHSGELTHLFATDEYDFVVKRMNGIIDRTREQPLRSLEVAKVIANLSIIAISVFGFPYGDSSDLTIRCFIIADTTPKVWGGFNYVNNHFKSLAAKQKNMLGSAKSYYIKTSAQILFEGSVGILSRFPDFLSFKFSGDRKITASLEIVGNAILQTYSVQLMIKSFPMVSRYWRDSTHVKLSGVKQEFINEIQRMKEHFIQMSKNERIVFIQTLQEIRNRAVSSERVNDYLSAMMLSAQRAPESPSWYKSMEKVGKVAFFLAFVAYPFTALPLNNWQISKAQGISDGGAGTLAVLPCIAFYLNFQCVLSTIRQFYPIKWNLTSHLKKMKAVGYKALGVILSAVGAYGFQRTGECVNPADSVNIPPALCIPFSWYFFTLANVSIHAFIDHVLEESLLAGEDEQARAQVLMKREFEKIADFIENIPTDEFIKSFLGFSVAIKNPLLQKFELTEEELAVFLNRDESIPRFQIKS